MSNKTINQLTGISGENINRTTDLFVVFDSIGITGEAKKLSAIDVVTTGVLDADGSTETDRVNKIVALTQSEYDGITAPDPETLYLITDGSSGVTGATYGAADGITLNGITFSIDETATIHVAGISSDGGITAAGDLNYTGVLNAYNGGQIKLRQSGANRFVVQDATLAQLNTTRFWLPNATEVLSANAYYHVAGISTDGGITFPDGTYQDTAFVSTNELTGISGESIERSADLFVLYDDSTSTQKKLPAIDVVTTGALDADGSTQTGKVNKILSLTQSDYDGITSPDQQTLYVITDGSTITDSYIGHIESPANTTYYLDPRIPVGRTITEFYAICGTGGISADLYNSGATVGSLNISITGATASLSNTSLAEGGTLEMVTTNNSSSGDLRFAIKFTQ